MCSKCHDKIEALDSKKRDVVDKTLHWPIKICPVCSKQFRRLNVKGRANLYCTAECFITTIRKYKTKEEALEARRVKHLGHMRSYMARRRQKEKMGGVDK